MKADSKILRVAKRELGRIAERRTLYMLSIFLPVILFLLIAVIYKNGMVRNLPVAIFDEDKSGTTRLLIRSIDATSSMDITKYVSSVEELKSEFRKGNIQGAFYFPKEFESELKKGKKTTVVIYKNTASLIIGNTIYKDGMTVVKTISGGALLKKLRSKGLTENKAMNYVNPIRIESQYLYNPNYNYEFYLIPSVIPALLQMIIIVAGVLLISSEFSHNTFNELVEVSGKSIFNIIVGKSLPHLAIHTCTILGIVGIIFPLFDVEVKGSIIVLIAFLIYFAAACFFIGLLISSVFHNQFFATELAVFLNAPAFMFSGYTFPLWGVPVLHNWFAQILPFTHFVTGYIKIYQMGAPVHYLIPEVIKLTLFIVLSLVVIWIVLKYQVSKSLKTSAGAIV
ncbi:MAG: ABC transporter permease [Ignavibacteriales bacterium]|nr:MAG: ABC transporter permease [Ignavibacteriales bacterium]